MLGTTEINKVRENLKTWLAAFNAKELIHCPRSMILKASMQMLLPL